MNGLNMHDLGARWYDMAGVPMWTSVDPLAEKYAYFDIPFTDNSFHKHKMDIKFNWDNTVTINEGTNKFDLQVNRIWIEPMLYPFSDKDYPLKLHNNSDSLFVGIFMYDDKNNEIDIYRQKRTLPLGRKRIGFRINLNGKVYVTGYRERFDY